MSVSPSWVRACSCVNPFCSIFALKISQYTLNFVDVVLELCAYAGNLSTDPSAQVDSK